MILHSHSYIHKFIIKLLELLDTVPRERNTEQYSIVQFMTVHKSNMSTSEQQPSAAIVMGGQRGQHDIGTAAALLRHHAKHGK